MLQILWERGWIDESKVVRFYTTNGKKIRKDDAKIIEGSSLKQLISNLPSFKKEITLLQFRVQQLGVSLHCSPKYHPEIAGKAIKFCWASSKNTYRHYQLMDKRTKEKFLKLVEDCQKVNRKQAVRIFCRQMCQYNLCLPCH